MPAKPNRITVYLSEKERKKVERLAKKNRRSISLECRILIEQAIEREENDANASAAKQ